MEREVVRQCPQCGYEYEPWVEICPDCGVAVESVERAPGGIPVLRPDEDPHWTVVMNAPNAIIGNFLVSQLKDAGIPVLMQRAPSADIAQFTGFDFVPQVLKVPRDRVDDAREVLDSRSDVSSSGYLWNTGLDWGSGSENEAATQEVETDDPAHVWKMLPTEDDVRARQQVRRWHGAVDDEDWEYEDEYPALTQVEAYSSGPRRASGQREDDAYYDYVDNYSDGDWYKSKWARIVYGILIAALTIPFIFQLLQQLGNILDGFGGGR